MLNAIRKGVSWLDARLNKPLEETAYNLKWLELELEAWLNSKERKDQIKADEYYRGVQDILRYKRTAIGEGGDLEEITNLPNHKTTDNQYKRLVNQKANYILGKPVTIDTKNEKYKTLLEKYMNKNFMRMIKNIAVYANNGGVAYIYPYYDSNELKFKVFKPFDIKVFYKDDEHTEIDFFWRYYTKRVRFSNGSVENIQHLEVYTLEGVRYFIYKGGVLLYDKQKGETTYSYLTYTSSLGNEVVEEQHLSFERMPLIPFKLNAAEQPLLKSVKSLQDGINTITTVFMNNMMEDARSTILIIMNYDGENLGEFRRNLSTYGAVKVRNTNEEKGGVDTLHIEVNAENYKVILELFKRAIIENGGGVDLKEIKSGTPNQMNIQAMFHDIELDTNDTETEFQCSFENLLWFVNFDINYKGEGNFFNETVNVIFNRDMLQDETTIIDNLMKLKGTISDIDIINMLPFGDAHQMIKNIEEQRQKEKEEMINDYDSVFKNNPHNNPQINNDLGDE